MDGKSIVVCIVVGVLGLISTGVGLAFQVMPIKTAAHLFYFTWNYIDYCTGEDCLELECVYFRSAAFFLVVAAIVCVFVAQIIISISTDCGCCSGRYCSSALQALAVLSFFSSWLACIAAIITYIIGAGHQYGVQFPEFGHFFSSLGSIWVDNTRCYWIKNGTFGAAAALSFGAVILGITSYLASIFGDKTRTRRRRIPGMNDNRDDDPSAMDTPIAIALPDVPATPVRRVATADRPYRTRTEQSGIPLAIVA